MPMFRNMRLYSLILVLAVLVTFAGGWTLKAEGSSFTDLAGAEWAWQATVEMAASGVVAGYPDGSYGPYNSVTKLEAVAMLIRMLGLEDQAKAAAEAGVDYNLPADLYWGSGYLIMAVQRGMLDEDYVYLLQPNAPATRTEVAMLVFHALKLNPDSSEMKFEDADQVAAEYRDGVAAVVKSGIMQGLPGNVFKPNDEINRAQMAVMMSRIVAYEFADPCPDRRADGTISELNLDSRVITISSAGSLFYTSDCEVFLGGISISPDKLQVGDEVELIWDKNKHAVFINAQRPGEELSYKGKVSYLQAVNKEYWLGIIREDGQEFSRLVAEGVTVNKLGSQLNITMLNEGDNIEILVSENKIIEINIIGISGSLEGIINDLDTTGNWGITIRSEDEDPAKYVVVEEAVVMQDGEIIEFSGLDEGELVRLQMDSRGRVDYVEVIDKHAVIEGTVNELVTDRSPFIRIKKSNGTRTQYDIDDNTDYYKDDHRIDLDEIVIGSEIKAGIDEDDIVIRIDVTNDEDITLEGTVIYVSESDNRVRIEQVSGNRFTYELADAPVLTDNKGHSINLEDVDEDSDVRIDLENGKITSLTVL